MALIRVAEAYRTTSTAALCVLIKMLPIHLVVKERAKLLERIAKNKNTAYRTRERAANEKKAEMRKEDRLRTIREWYAATYGDWTKCLITKLKTCITWGATDIGRPSNPNPDRSWMVQSISLPKWLGLPCFRTVKGSRIRRHVLFE